MKEPNYRQVLLNRASITLSSSIYDRRALDSTCDRPLVNSLNNLTYLSSNSPRVRDMLAKDGGIERLVLILKSCFIDSGCETTIENRKVEALCAWKWTLAYQCLVLAGTRGNEDIRKRVVEAGILPVVATVLDNYLLYNRNIDHLNGTELHSPFSTVMKTWLVQSVEGIEADYKRRGLTLPPFDTNNASYAEVLQYYNKLSRHVEGELPGIFCESSLNVSSMVEQLVGGESMSDEHIMAAMQVPRDFFHGKIVPKADDVIWSLQLLAFISKYTCLKPYLQDCHLVNSLSLRSVMEKVSCPKQHDFFDSEGDSMQIEKIESMDTELISAFSSDDDHGIMDALAAAEAEIGHTEKKKMVTTPVGSFQATLHMGSQPASSSSNSTIDDSSLEKFISHLQDVDDQVQQQCQKRHEQVYATHKLVEQFDSKWDYDTYNFADTDTNDLDADLEIRHRFNIFPLVEKFTVRWDGHKDMEYWSAVIMRNSCRKDEDTGVRQCANFSCGKWEDFPRQFSKCRRCKRTKYCSRECQIEAWTYHKYWCTEAQSPNGSSASQTTTVRSSNAME